MKKFQLSTIKTFLFCCFILCLINCQTKDSFKGATFTVDIDSNKAPIEKYIYGQFIEHLGKCIYGGIWAEMLMDRKFYYPITDDYNPWETASEKFWGDGSELNYPFLARSPWEVIGKDGSVRMIKQNAYVGDHTPTIEVYYEKTGIRQNGLSVEKGKRYTGRIVLAGSSSLLPITIQLISPAEEKEMVTIDKISNNFETYSFEMNPDFASDSVSFEIFSNGTGKLSIGAVSLMPADNVKGWRPDVVELMKQLNSPIYRWPGGNFVSGYNWRDGVGEMDKRPPRKNPAWKGVEHNDVGIHEYMELMEMINAEPFIAVNTGLGTVEEVAEEIAYCNGSSDSEQGKIRAANGHPEPFNVKWWAVGNEMYGDWQLGHMPLSEYVKKHNSMAEAILEVDPNAKLIGVGHVGEWSETMLSQSGDHMDLLSEHIYATGSKDPSVHMKQVANQIKNVANAHRKYRDSIPGLSDMNIRIAMDEWNYWYGDYIYGELGVRYYHQDAIGIAKGLHEYFRNSDIYFMANYAQTVNVIGCIKTTPTDAGFATTALPLILYRNHFETIPVEIGIDTSNLDVVAATNPEKTIMTIAIVNEHPTEKVVNFDFGNTSVSKSGEKWIIQNDDVMAYNNPGETPAVELLSSEITIGDDGVVVPPYSIQLLKFKIDK